MPPMTAAALFLLMTPMKQMTQGNADMLADVMRTAHDSSVDERSIALFLACTVSSDMRMMRSGNVGSTALKPAMSSGDGVAPAQSPSIVDCPPLPCGSLLPSILRSAWPTTFPRPFLLSSF